MSDLSTILSEVESIAKKCRGAAAEFDEPKIEQDVSLLTKAIESVARASSGSWIGYQSRVYLEDFNGNAQDWHFDTEWGFEGSFSTTTQGPWREYRSDVVKEHIFHLASVGSLGFLDVVAKKCGLVFESAKTSLVPLLDALVDQTKDKAIQKRRDEVEKLTPRVSFQDIVHHYSPQRVGTRDYRAGQGGISPPPHFQLQAEIWSLLSCKKSLNDLAGHAEYVHAYLSKKQAMGSIFKTSNKPKTKSAGKFVEDRVDIAIITVIKEEYIALRRALGRLGSELVLAPGTKEQPNLYSWELTVVESTRFEKPYRVVVAYANAAGGDSGLLVTLNTIRVWKPRYALLIGVAGGISLNGVSLGDLVVSSQIWGYEYGKVGSHGFVPRSDYTFQVDGALSNAAASYAHRQSPWREEIKEVAPGPSEINFHYGPIASGDKVVDDLSSDLFAPVLQHWPKLMAVEMEGVGAAHATKSLQDEGKAIGLLMIRGISDVPKSGAAAVKEQTIERDNWKPFASAVAATFAVNLIKYGWPAPPIDEPE